MNKYMNEIMNKTAKTIFYESLVLLSFQKEKPTCLK